MSNVVFFYAGENVEFCGVAGLMAAKACPIILILADLDLILVAVQATLVVLLLVPILLALQYQKDLVLRTGSIIILRLYAV